MPLSKIHNTLTSDHILLDGTDSTSANANSKILLDASASNTDVGSIMSFESGASDSSVTNTSTFLDDIKTTDRTAGRTVILPNTTGNVVTTGDSSTFFGVDQWYLNTNHSTNDTMTAWTRVPATDGGGNIGSAMSVSSGVWTFPTTGVWLINGSFTLNATQTDNDVVAIVWEMTDDGGSFSSQFTNRPYAQAYTEDEGHIQTKNVFYVFDCQDTSTHKLRMKGSGLSSPNYIVGNQSSLFYTMASFIRLGDT